MLVIVPGKELRCILGKLAFENISVIKVQNDVISQIDIKEKIKEKYPNVLNDVGEM